MDRDGETEACDLAAVINVHPALKQLKAGFPPLIEGNDFPIHDEPLEGQAVEGQGYLWITRGYLSAAAREQTRVLAIANRHSPDPVVLQLEQPLLAVHALFAQLREHERKGARFKLFLKQRCAELGQRVDQLLPDPGAILELRDGEPRQDRARVFLRDVLVLSEFIALLDEQPLLLLARPLGIARAGANQGENSVEFVTAQDEVDLALVYRFRWSSTRGVDHRVGAAIPDDDCARPVVALGNDSLKVAVLKRMVLNHHCQPFVARVQSVSFRDRPGSQNPVHFHPEVEMHPACMVLLDDKNATFRRVFRRLRAAERLRSAIGTTFAAVSIEWHG